MAEAPQRALSSVRHKILVLSGKGGVGKSTVATQLALAFVRLGKRVGLLDVDLTGPSVPHIVGLDTGEVKQSTQGFVPVYTDESKRLGVMSIGFLLQNKDDAVVWRGPKKNAVIKNFMEDVAWGDLDYLIIDTPPGTSDEHISTIEHLAAYTPDGAVLVTTPQGVATSDVQRELTFCQKTNLPVLGVVENMSGFYCPSCSECTYVFSKGGGEELAKQRNVPFIGRIPIDPRIAIAMDEGKPFKERFPESGALKALDDFARAQIGEGAAPSS